MERPLLSHRVGSRQGPEEMRVRPRDEPPGWTRVSARLDLPTPGAIEAANATAGAAGGAQGLAEAAPRRRGRARLFLLRQAAGQPRRGRGAGEDGGVPVAERRWGEAPTPAAGRALGAGHGALPARPARMEAPARHLGAAG